VEDLRLALAFEGTSTSTSPSVFDTESSTRTPNNVPSKLNGDRDEDTVVVGGGSPRDSDGMDTNVAGADSGGGIIRKPKLADPSQIQTRVLFKSNRKFAQELYQEISLKRQVASESNLADWDIENETNEDEDEAYEFEDGAIDRLTGLPHTFNRSRTRTLSRSSTLYSEDETIADTSTLTDSLDFEPISVKYQAGPSRRGENHLGEKNESMVSLSEEAATHIQVSGNICPTECEKIAVGSSMKMAPEAEWISCSWIDGDASDFSVRSGPNYARYKTKTTSGSALYKTIACDVLRNVYNDSNKIHHIGDHEEIIMPELHGVDMDLLKKSPLPGVIICNCQIPLKPPKMMGKPEADPGISLIFYYQISEETLSQSLDPSSASPAVRHLIRFVKEAQSKKDMRRRFKLIGMVMNMAEIGLPSFLRGYNGKPAIINKSGQLFFGKTSGPNPYSYMEMDILVHTFAFIARKGLYSVRDSISRMSLRAGFVIQAEDDDEMPECLFGCTALFNLNYAQALPVNLPPKQWIAH